LGDSGLWCISCCCCSSRTESSSKCFSPSCNTDVDSVYVVPWGDLLKMLWHTQTVCLIKSISGEQKYNIWSYLLSGPNPTSHFTLGDWLAVWSVGTHIPTARISKLKVIFMQFLFIFQYLGLNVRLYFFQKISLHSVNSFLTECFRRIIDVIWTKIWRE
jgi:hypothetical protein